MVREPFDEPDSILHRQFSTQSLKLVQLRASPDDIQLDGISGAFQTLDDQIGAFVRNQTAIMYEAEIATRVNNTRSLVEAIKYAGIDRVDELVFPTSRHQQRSTGTLATGNQQNISLTLAREYHTIAKLQKWMKTAPQTIGHGFAVSQGFRVMDVAVNWANHYLGSRDTEIG